MNITKDIFLNIHQSTNPDEYNVRQDHIYNNVNEQLLGANLLIKTEDDIKPLMLAINPSTLANSLCIPINDAFQYIKRECIKEEESHSTGNNKNIPADIVSNSLGKDSNNSSGATVKDVPRIKLAKLNSLKSSSLSANSAYTKCIISQDSNHSNYLCSNCPFTTTSIMEAVLHFVNNEAGKVYQFLIRYNADNSEFECGVHSNFSTTSSDRALQHWKEHLPNSSLKCFLCSFYSKDDNLLKGHLLSHLNKMGIIQKEKDIREFQGGSEKKPFWCIKCHANISSIEQLQKHYLRVHGGNRFVCNLCEAKFYYAEDVKIHVNQVHAQSCFQCLHCNSVIKHRNSFRHHMRVHMEDFQNYTYDKSKVLQMLSKTNMQEVSNNLSKSDIFSLPNFKQGIGEATGGFSTTSIDCTGSHRCKYCSFTAILKKYITQHVRKVHVDKFLICNLCNKQFAKKRTLERHMMIIHESKILQCPHCDFKTRHNKNLSKHLEYHTGELSQLCYICGFRNADEKNMNLHIIRHTGLKSWFCNLCKYQCVSQSRLSSHMITHTNEKPFPCTVCDHRSKTKEHLKYHEQTHLKTKQFLCTICNYSAGAKYFLNKHMETHSGNRRQFHCEICDKKYLSLNALKMHKLSHAHIDTVKSYNCTECSKSFIRVVSLQNHMKTHTGIGRMYCLECNYSSTHKANFIEHVNKTCAKAKHSHESQMHCYLCGYASSHRSNFINHVIKCAKVKRKGLIVKVKSNAKVRRNK